MYFDQNNNYFDIDDSFNITFDRDTKLFSLDEGFNKVNMFKDIYSKYKNHVYKLKVSNEKDKLLYNIQMYTFALKDLNLYLDIHTDDKHILKKFSEYSMELKKLKDKYNKTYGPLCSFDSDRLDEWEWTRNPWPWDKGGNY